MITAQLKNLKKVSSIQEGFTLIELLVVIGILAILMGIVLIAINPAHQFALANDTTRRNAVSQILSAVGQYEAENKGQLPPVITTTPTVISKTGIDLCAVLVTQFIPALPQDPKNTPSTDITDCTTSYNTGYSISKDASGRVTVSATPEITGTTISVTR